MLAYERSGYETSFAAGIPVAAFLAEKGRPPVMIAVTVLIGLNGFVYAGLFQRGIHV